MIDSQNGYTFRTLWIYQWTLQMKNHTFKCFLLRVSSRFFDTPPSFCHHEKLLALFSVNYCLQNRHVPADMVDDFLFTKQEHQTIFWSTNFWINWVNDFLNEVLVILNDIVKLRNLLIWGITRKVSDLF